MGWKKPGLGLPTSPWEGRRHPRVRLSTAAKIQAEESQRSSSGEIKNISVEGVGLLTPDTLAPGSEVQIRFGLPSGLRIEAFGLVVHARQDLPMGIQFLRLRDDDRKAIEKLVQQTLR